MKHAFTLFASLLLFCGTLSAQPWNNALMIASGSDGTTFNAPQVFQDSSGVPSLIQLPDGRLLAAFQWFPAPVMGDNWDSIAVKFSSDTGLTWSAPYHCNFTGMPPNFWRPFDPALANAGGGQIRMYFSSGPTGSTSLDSTINTYSAISSDGINYAFEGGIRYDDTSLPVIDPTVTYFGGQWHYTAPRGAPQDGAFHATSNDGLTFTPLAAIPSDNVHQWTGNLMANDNDSMRFYGGSFSGLWWASSNDGSTWSSFNATNITAGGDPTVLRLPDSTYLIIYVGPPNLASVAETGNTNALQLYPNPAAGPLRVTLQTPGDYRLRILDAAGREVMAQEFSGTSATIDAAILTAGVYIVEVFDTARNAVHREKFVR